jgi:hypothetical protein
MQLKANYKQGLIIISLSLVFGFIITFLISGIGKFNYSYSSTAGNLDQSLEVQKITYTSAFGIKIESGGLGKTFDNVEEQSHELSFSQQFSFIWQAFMEVLHYGLLISILAMAPIYSLINRKTKK